MQDDIDRVIISEAALAARVARLAQEIAVHYQNNAEPMVIVTILSGALVFVADLIRRLPIRMRLGLIGVSSYPGSTRESRGARIKAHLDPDVALRGQHVLIVDDILDSGNTLRLVQQMISAGQPKSLRTAVLLRKPNKAPADVSVDYVGFDIADEFVVGYGLDYDGQYRNLPHIAVLKPEHYASGSADPRTEAVSSS